MNDFWHFFVTNRMQILHQTLRHLELTFAALTVAVVIGIPLGIACTRYRKISGPTLGAVGVIQTIPSIALLGFMIPLLGIGAIPAIVALFLYALLPIVRNTYAGINEVDASVVEAARGMGMTGRQILTKVELPLAMPVIFAGIRTATVISVGVATLCALIGAGGLGQFIFRGIALNNSIMILAGALPAALLAILFDNILGFLEQRVGRLLKPLAWGLAVILLVGGVWAAHSFFASANKLKIGVPPEFLERSDGWPGLTKRYDLHMPTVEMNAALMYKALKNGRVDVAVGYSTDGRIKAYHLKVLKDDKHYFPPYDAAPLVRTSTLQQHPGLRKVLNKLAGKISTKKMTALNSRVDQNKEDAAAVAKDFLQKHGFKTSVHRSGSPDFLIGGKLQTEQYILGHMYKLLIENNTSLDVGLKMGLAGTKVVFNALKNGEINMYPEYTGTGLHVLLKADSSTVKRLGNNPQKVYHYVKKHTQKRFNLSWLKPIGFNNTYALLMRRKEAKKLGIQTISDLARYLKSH
ncbi:MAG TPA: ABC transporter permease/substrate-binding protein [Balneolaceae bacterium]|nr:ABC transporter permease/substrate-binding protein [Balneolaceae bacterium]